MSFRFRNEPRAGYIVDVQTSKQIFFFDKNVEANVIVWKFDLHLKNTFGVQDFHMKKKNPIPTWQELRKKISLSNWGGLKFTCCKRALKFWDIENYEACMCFLRQEKNLRCLVLELSNRHLVRYLTVILVGTTLIKELFVFVCFLPSVECWLHWANGSIFFCDVCA